MRVSLIGPPLSGKSTLFAAVAEAGGGHPDLHRPDQAHLAVVKVPDQRVHWLARLCDPKKIVEAELEFLDLPGFDLADPAGRNRAKAHWAAMRQSDMIVLVVRSFADPTVPEYRSRVDAAADVAELLAEMLFADLEQVTNRVEKLTAAIRKPTGKRDEQQHELELMQRLQETLEAEKPIAEAIGNEAEEKWVRSFAFLSLKPTLAVANCAEDAAAALGPEQIESLPCLQLSAKIEEEIAQLSPDERGEFLAAMDLSSAARDRLIQACYRRLNLVSFLTMGDECRAWSVPAGTTAVEAAGEIHTDMARGFIRAETVAYDDLNAAGDMKSARAAGKVRLEGKTYVVQDGDVINFRFNV